MRIDAEDFRRHYAMLSDEALFDLDRSELIETAQACYDAEVAKRKADRAHPREVPRAAENSDDVADDLEADAGQPPEWLDNSACACSFTANPGAEYSPARARSVLRAAAIPCYVALEEMETPPSAARTREEYCVMVPGGLNLHAISVLDRDLFNADQEEHWRAELASLSDEDLKQLSPDLLCAGLLDRAARLKRAYEEEVARRAAR